ncbi:MAG: hypothetical protein HYU39_00325 [Thaumarchaeota archaeon]|nr:hypothetical protein [Nitrososphaerota archaeon]
MTESDDSGLLNAYVIYRRLIGFSPVFERNKESVQSAEAIGRYELE